MNTQRTILAVVVALVFGVPGLRAQTQAKPDSQGSAGQLAPAPTTGAYPAARGIYGPEANESYVAPQAEPDTHALSGVESFTVGSYGVSQNIFDVAMFANEYGRTGLVDASGQTMTGAVTVVGGNLNLSHAWSNSRFSAYYNGANTMQSYPLSSASQYSYWYQDLRAEQVVELGRWALTFRDDLLASSQAAFGGQALGGPGLLVQFSPLSTMPLGGLNPGFGTGDTILTGPSMRVLNTAVGEANYSFSRRSMVTFSGSYGFQHFLTSGFLDNRQVTGQVGYDYALSPVSLLAVVGGYNRITFIGSSGVIDTDLAELAYGRKITGRLAFQLAAGPERVQLRDLGTGSSADLGWAVNSILTYELRRTGYSISYAHMTTPGSGVFFGSWSHIVTVEAHRRLTRFWLAGVNVGYAHSDSLVPVPSAPNTYYSWYGGANLSRQIGRYFNVAFNYGIQKQQEIGGNVSPVPSAGTTGLIHTFGMTVTLHLQPASVE